MHVMVGRFELDTSRRLLLDAGTQVHLSPKAFRLLEVLAGNSPRALSKEELHDAVWPKTFVEESNLAGLVTELRSALGDGARNPRFVRTVHGFGYGLCCDVQPLAPRARAAAVLFQGEELPLFDGDNVLGRDPAADVTIDDPTVSRRHAVITIAGDGAILQDLSSKNGTTLDGVKLEGSAPLLEGQTIILGDARLVFRRAPGPGSTLTLAGTARKR
jgi:DNA-binding winged helix-turn-helix (wHTH) protein